MRFDFWRREGMTMDDIPTIEQPVPVEDDGWTWAIVEIFGHRRHVGRSREEEKFGSKLCRIDVPKIDAAGTVTWSSHFYGGASIFSFTPTDEKTVMKYSERPHVPAIPYHEPDDDQDYEEDRG
jgi:hypothetical protein